ncbi:hypothetical protein ABW19_dt0204514 [Dactylella cylindrospora]|nr:hypothetical protein ABW19_dt0204514 [Dactylella cylindrospora]
MYPSVADNYFFPSNESLKRVLSPFFPFLVTCTVLPRHTRGTVTQTIVFSFFLLKIVLIFILNCLLRPKSETRRFGVDPDGESIPLNCIDPHLDKHLGISCLAHGLGNYPRFEFFQGGCRLSPQIALFTRFLSFYGVRRR